MQGGRLLWQIGLAGLFGALVAHDLSWHQMPVRPGDDTARAVSLPHRCEWLHLRARFPVQ
jgi:hypothetical protein